MPEPRSLPVTYTAPTEQDHVSVGHPDIPAHLVDGDAMRIDHEGLDQVINLDIEVLEEVDSGTDLTTLWMPVWVSTTDEIVRQSYTLSTVLVAWDDISGKPSTFPPTLPIALSDVTGLQAQLDALTALNDIQDAQIAAMAVDIAALEARVAFLEGYLSVSPRQYIVGDQFVTVWG